jgi:hypothetical protein
MHIVTHCVLKTYTSFKANTQNSVSHDSDVLYCPELEIKIFPTQVYPLAELSQVLQGMLSW